MQGGSSLNLKEGQLAERERERERERETEALENSSTAFVNYLVFYENVYGMFFSVHFGRNQPKTDGLVSL